MERCRWCAGLSCGLGTIHRSGQSRHETPSCISASQSSFFLFFYKFAFYFSIHKGRNVETVEVADEFHTLSRLQSDTEYIVTIIPLYEGNTEGPVATARFNIGRCGFRSSTPNICLYSLGIILCSFYRLHSHNSELHAHQNCYLPHDTKFHQFFVFVLFKLVIIVK